LQCRGQCSIVRARQIVANTDRKAILRSLLASSRYKVGSRAAKTPRHTPGEGAAFEAICRLRVILYFCGVCAREGPGSELNLSMAPTILGGAAG
jgi:hypothetical protein